MSKQFNQNPALSLETYSQLISSLEDYAIVTTDKKNKITGWLAGAENIMGFKEEEVIGKSINLFFTDEDVKNNIPEKETGIALKEGRSANERWHLKKDRKRFWGFGLTFPLRNDKQEVIGFTKIFRDLTERKEAEEALKRSYRELEELNYHKEKIVSVLSHDLRSPLNSIIGSCNILQSDLDKMNEKEILRVISIQKNSANKIISMLEELVGWARAKLSEDIFNPEEVKLCLLVSKAYSILKNYADQKGIKFYNKVKESVLVKADRKMLLSVFQNLLSNAIKYTDLEGNISVSAVEENGKVIIRVSDTGIGIPEEVKNSLFKEKPVSSGKGTNQEVGSGIGLMLVKEFVLKNGGEIWIESEKGKGTSIIFTLQKV